MQEEVKCSSNRNSQLVIALFETIPDFIKNMKIGLKDKERAYAESKERGDALMKSLEDTIRNL